MKNISLEFYAKEEEKIMTNPSNEDKTLNFIKMSDKYFQSNYQYETNSDPYDTNEKNDFNEICTILNIKIDNAKKKETLENEANYNIKSSLVGSKLEAAKAKDTIDSIDNNINNNNNNCEAKNNINTNLCKNQMSKDGVVSETAYDNDKSENKNLISGNITYNKNENTMKDLKQGFKYTVNNMALPPKSIKDSNSPIRLVPKNPDFLNLSKLCAKNSVLMHKENPSKVKRKDSRASLDRKRNNSLSYSVMNPNTNTKNFRKETSESILSTSCLNEKNRNSQASNFSKSTTEIKFENRLNPNHYLIDSNIGYNNSKSKIELEELENLTKNLSGVFDKNSSGLDLNKINYAKEINNNNNPYEIKSYGDQNFYSKASGNSLIFPEEDFELGNVSYNNSNINSTNNLDDDANFNRIYEQNYSKLGKFDSIIGNKIESEVDVSEEIDLIRKKSFINMQEAVERKGTGRKSTFKRPNLSMILEKNSKIEQSVDMPNANKAVKSSGQINIDFENLKIFSFDNKIDNEIKIKKHKNAINRNSQIEINKNINKKTTDIIKPNEINGVISRNIQEIKFDRKRSSITVSVNNLKSLSKNEWKEMIDSNQIDNRKRERIILSLKKGIDEDLREDIWILLSSASKISEKYSPTIIEQFIQTKNEFAESLIINDINRTLLLKKEEDGKNYVVSDFFEDEKNKKKLYNILKAYSVFDLELAYCQGTNYIAAILLCNLKSENFCFWVFYQLMNKFDWRRLFIDNSTYLIKKLEKFVAILEEKIPVLYNYFEEIDFIEMLKVTISPYFISIFTYKVPMEYATRILDLFWIYQDQVIYDALIHLLEISQNKILKTDYESLIQFIRYDLVKENIMEYGLLYALPY